MFKEFHELNNVMINVLQKKYFQMSIFKLIQSKNQFLNSNVHSQKL